MPKFNEPMSTLIPLNITIGDRNYRIKIMPENEEIVRKTLKVINEQIVEYKTNFAGKDMQDYIAMVLIWYATQLQDNSGVFNEQWMNDLAMLNLQVKEALEEEP